MDADFHYYITKGVAIRAGLTERDAEVLAYASQYIDNNTRQYTINPGKPSAFTNLVSQSYHFFNPTQKRIPLYICFHFIPGDPLYPMPPRKDGRTHPLVTTPDSPNARRILRKALSTHNLYQAGLAVHSYVDTFAHQGFTGTYDHYNAMPGLRALLTPNIGHADACHAPDLMGLCWKDPRLCAGNPLIDNNARFLSATLRLFEELCRWNGKGSRYRERHGKILQQDMRALMKNHEPDLRIRSSHKKKYQKVLGITSQYHSFAWFHEAINYFPAKKEYRFRQGYRQSHWYRFQCALKEHVQLCTDILSPYLKDYSLEIFSEP